MSLPSTDWNYPTTIWFGNGRVATVASACRQLGMERPLLVTDEALVKLDITEHVRARLEADALDYCLFSEVQGNPTGANVQAGVRYYRQQACDGVIAFGGGSAIDAAKTIALVAGQTRPLWDFEDVGDNWQRANPGAIAPIVAIPTTAGTGSEVGRAAVILDQQAHSKKIIFHPQMLPDIVIADPELCLQLPRNITAWTGIDALVHALEAYCAPGFHPMADGIATEAIRMIFRYLPIVYADGSNLEARGQMQVAASMGATAFQKGLGSIHSVSHQLGALYNVQHGLANAILLPYGLRQNAEAIAPRMAHLCRVLELPKPGSDSMIDAVLKLRQALGIPHSLAEIGIDDQRAEEIGRMAFADACTPTNARPLGADDLEALFRAAQCGALEAL